MLAKVLALGNFWDFSPTVCVYSVYSLANFGLNNNLFDASLKCKKEFLGNYCAGKQSSILMIGINILIFLLVSIKWRQ